MSINLVTGFAGVPHVSSIDHGALNIMIFGYDSFVLPFNEEPFKATILRQDSVQAEISIADGDMMMQGRHVRATGEPTKINIPMPPQHYYRKDLIVMRYTKDISNGVESCSIARLEGEEDDALLGTPNHTTGDLTDAGCILHEVPLYRVVMYDGKITDIEQMFTVKNPLSNIKAPAVQFGHAVIEHSVGRDTSVYVEFPVKFERTPHVFVSQVFNNANIVVKTSEVTSAGFTARLGPVSYNEWRPFSWFAIA